MQKLILPLIISFSTAGCVTRGTHEVVKINSNPVAARAISDVPTTKKDNINGFYGCEPTPCSINFSRRSNPVISVEKEGYKSIKFKVVSSIATSSSSVPPGSIVAGTPAGSYVIAGEPHFLKKIPVGGLNLVTGILSLGTSVVADVATGSGLSLSPKSCDCGISSR
ncbi:MAG: hypothetical protein ABJG88_03915 [Litorimonas sp.]